MSCVYTNDLKNQTANWGAEGFIIPTQPTVKPTMWGLVYLHPRARAFSCFHVFLFIYLFSSYYSSCVYLWKRLSKCGHPSQEGLKNPPRGPSHIWLWIDDLYLWVKYPVGLTRAPTLATIRSLHRFCLELSWNPIFWFIGVQICCISFYMTSSHLLQISFQCVFREQSLSLSRTDSKPRRF